MRQDAWACRDQCTPSMHATCARCAHDLRSLAHGQSAVRAATPTTWALRVQCARAMCARPGFWVCALCTQPSFDSVHCLQSLFGSLFMSTTHEHC